MLIDIALDAVGSDKAPEPEIRGAILACRSLPVRVHLIGPEAELRDILDEHLENEDLPIVIHHASERIGMEEKAAHAVRTKKDSSMRVGLKLVREGKAAGFVTAGNTGAAMATAKMVLARCRAWIGRRWQRRCRVRRGIRACCWMWAPTWTASRITWSSSR
jgi:glycerol-3-phosphate acyltransferase PlsX